MAQTPDTPDNDAAYDPNDLNAAENARPESQSDDSGDPSNDGGENIDNVRNQEGNWQNKTSAQKSSSPRTNIRGFFKKKGPLALIGALIFGGGAGLTLLTSPSIALVQFRQILSGDLNDQIRGMEVLDNHLLSAKLEPMQKGVCTSLVSFRCRLATMSKTEVKNFTKAGITVEPKEPDKVFGRTKPTKWTFPDGTEITNPNELRTHLKKNPAIRSDLRKAFNPRFAGLYDKVAAGIFAKFKTDRSDKIQGDTDEERDKSLDAATAGESAGLSVRGAKMDEEGREYVETDSGVRVYEEQPSSGSLPEGSVVDSSQFHELLQINVDIAAEAEKSIPGSTAMDGVLGNAAKGLSVVNAGNTACGIYKGGRVISAAAKVSRALQLGQYFVVAASIADSIMAGEGYADADDIAWLGTKYAAIDTRETITDEQSTWEGGSADSAVAASRPNPYYNANAYDSAGYAAVAYNDAPIPTARDLQFAVGGGLSGTLSSVLDTIAAVLGGRENIRATCKALDSWWVQGTGLVVGIASAIGSFGISTVVSIGGSVALGFAMPYIQAALADIIKGTVVSSKTKGVDSGNAAVFGAGAFYGNLAMGHGMRPAGAGNLKQYLASTNETHLQHIAADVYDAKKAPLDIYNEHSFLGMTVRKINPEITKTNAQLASLLQSMPSILDIAAKSLVPTSNAYTPFNEARFTRIEDEGYEELGIDADIGGFPRFYMADKQLATPPDPAVAWMESHGHMDEAGTPLSDEYKDWLTYCTQRTDGWGESSDEQTDEAIGLICVEKGKTSEEIEKLNYFGVATMYYSLQDTRDNDYAVSTSANISTVGSATPEMCKNMAAEDPAQIACKAYQFDAYGYLWAGGHGGSASKFMSDFKAGKFSPGTAILDCSGLVRMAIFDATGKDIGSLSTGDYPGYSKFKEVTKEGAQAGDIIWTPSHTEIIVSNNPGKKQFKTFGAHTDEGPIDEEIGPATYNYSDVTKVFRFTG